MAETCLEDVLTTGQLLGALQERIASILFVEPSRTLTT